MRGDKGSSPPLDARPQSRRREGDAVYSFSSFLVVLPLKQPPARGVAREHYRSSIVQRCERRRTPVDILGRPRHAREHQGVAVRTSSSERRKWRGRGPHVATSWTVGVPLTANTTSFWTDDAAQKKAGSSTTASRASGPSGNPAQMMALLLHYQLNTGRRRFVAPQRAPSCRYQFLNRHHRLRFAAELP